jgi:hypothetical protein
MFRRHRETMIALRARHKALEVTREIAYPPLEMPPPPEPVIRIAPGELWYPLPPPPSQRIEFRYEPAPEPTSKLGRFLMSDVVLSVAAIVIGIAVVLMCKYG